MEKVRTLKLNVIPKLVIPIELPKDPEGDGDETMILNFEVKRQKPENAMKAIAKCEELKGLFHDGEIDEMSYAEKMLGILCEKTHWGVLKKYDLLYINQIMEHIQKENENYKKKFSASTPSKT